MPPEIAPRTTPMFWGSLLNSSIVLSAGVLCPHFPSGSFLLYRQGNTVSFASNKRFTVSMFMFYAYFLSYVCSCTPRVFRHTCQVKKRSLEVGRHQEDSQRPQPTRCTARGRCHMSHGRMKPYPLAF